MCLRGVCRWGGSAKLAHVGGSPSGVSLYGRGAMGGVQWEACADRCTIAQRNGLLR